MKAIAQVNVAVDEIFSNIARYSGATSVVLGCSLKDGRATLRFPTTDGPMTPLKSPIRIQRSRRRSGRSAVSASSW